MSKAAKLKVSEMSRIVVEALEDVKAVDIKVLDVESMSNFTDHMIVASGATTRQVKALANSVIVEAKKAGMVVLGHEGDIPGEWILIDLGDVVVHVMVPQVRDFYNLEKLWSVEGRPVEEDNEL